MQAIAQHKVSNAVLVPTMINMLLSHPDFDRYDLSSLQTCVYGGSPMPEALMMEAMKRLPTWRFFQVFGMTETGGFATVLRWRDHIPLRPEGQAAALGRPAGVRQRGEGGAGRRQRSPRRTRSGEIVVRSDMLMNGYLNNPEATAAVLQDGWMHTGDAGTIDEDGFLYVADRVKDMIVTGGENVYSIEVERVLFMHPAVREAARDRHPERAVGRERPCGRRPQGRRQRHRGRARRALPPRISAATRCHAATSSADEPLPVTPIGKVRKNVLRDPYWVGRDRKIG